MAVYESAQELIGKTPLVRLAYSGFPEDVKVYAKLESKRFRERPDRPVYGEGC